MRSAGLLALNLQALRRIRTSANPMQTRNNSATGLVSGPSTGHGAWLHWGKEKLRQLAVPQAGLSRWAIVSLVLVLLAVISYLVTVGKLAVNFPYWDDYYAVLDSLAKVRDTDCLSGRVNALVAQHNEHRLVLLRLLVLSCRALEGQVDFRTLVWIGNLGLLSLTAILVAGANQSARWPAVLALLPLALLSPIQDKQMLWAMASISNFWVLAFAAAALLLLTRSSRLGFGFACALAFLATFTSGQGLLCFPAGIILLLFYRQWRRVAFWFGTMAVAIGCYLYGYVRPEHHPLPEISWTTLQFFPVAAGGALSELLCRCLTPVLPDPRWQAALFPTLQFLVGLLVVGLTGWLWFQRYYRRNPFLSIFMLYLLLLCATASISRGAFGLQQALMPHYRVISVCLTTLAVIGWLDWRYRHHPTACPQPAICAAGFAFCALAWALGYSSVRAFSIEQTEARRLFLQEQDARGFVRLPFREQAVDILWRSYLTGSLPFRDLETGGGPHLSVERLNRLAVRGADDLKLAGAANRVAAGLCWRGDELIVLVGRPLPPETRAAGWLLVRGNALEYVLPRNERELAHAPGGQLCP